MQALDLLAVLITLPLMRNQRQGPGKVDGDTTGHQHEREVAAADQHNGVESSDSCRTLLRGAEEAAAHAATATADVGDLHQSMNKKIPTFAAHAADSIPGCFAHFAFKRSEAVVRTSHGLPRP